MTTRSSIAFYVNESSLLHLDHCKLWLCQWRLSECVCAAMHWFIGWQTVDFTVNVGATNGPQQIKHPIAPSAVYFTYWTQVCCIVCSNPDPPLPLKSPQLKCVCVVGVSFIHSVHFVHHKTNPQLQISVKRLRSDSCSSGEQYNLVIWAGCENAHFLFFFSPGDNRNLLLWFGFCRVCTHLDEEQWGLLVV